MMHSTSSSLLSSTSSSSPDLILGDSSTNNNNNAVATAAAASAVGTTGSSVSALSPARNRHRQRWNQWRTHLLGGSRNDDDNASSVVEERRRRFERLVHEHPYPDAYVSSLTFSQPGEFRGNENHEHSRSPSNEVSVTSTSLDPLTALVIEEERKTQSMAELDLQYRKDKARRRRGNHHGRFVADEDESFDASAAALEIIDKDLERLHTNQDKALLRSILYVYHCCHSPDPGYRQGMHEVAGHLLRAATTDDDDDDDSEEEIGGSARRNEPPQAPQPQDQSSALVAGDVYAVLEAVLEDITPAYDVATTSDRKPLEAMGVRIITMVGKADPQLWDRLHHLHVPPAIYLTKWIRLLFGREVRDVMGLWDVAFELASQLKTPNPDSAHAPLGGGPRPLLAVLEALAAARLLHHRRQVLLGDDPLHFLMNVPVEDNIAPIVNLAKPILAGQALLLPPIVLPPPEGAASGPTGAPRAARGSPTSLRSSLMGLTSTAASASATTHPGAAAGTPSLSTAFSSMRQQFTEALDKTSSISKRLYHEWENLAADKALDDPQRSYDDDAWQRAKPTTATAGPSSFSEPPWNSAAAQAGSTGAAAAPRSIVDPVDNPLGGGGGGAATSHVASSFARALPPASSPTQPPPQFVAAEMEMHVATLQNYCMNAQRVHHDVPPAVWESLAQLERLRQSLLAGSSTQAHPHPHPPPPHHPSFAPADR